MDNGKSLFETLHAQYQPMVRTMCMGFVKGDFDVANDLSQEVFINVWSAIEKFRGDASYKTWIYRITVNTCLQYLRKEKSKQRVSLRAVESSLPTETARDDKELYDAIGQLSEIDRLIIMMVLDELAYEEIAKVVGIRPVNLRVKIHRIKSRLKNILEYEQ